MFASTTFLTAAVLVLIAILCDYLYQLLRSRPLHHVPGPFVAKFSSLFLHIICYLGVEGRVLYHYHQKYGSVIQVAPNSVSISDSDAIRDIYVAAGGFPKDERYRNFNLGPVVSIFSSIDTAYRDLRAKAVAPLFASAQLRHDRIIGDCIVEFVEQLRAFRNVRVRTDILDLCACLSIDVVTGYLLGKRYGGLNEKIHLKLEEKQLPEAKLSANGFIHAIVAFARFSLLPNNVFKVIYSISQRLNSSEHVTESFVKLDQFITDIMRSTSKSTGNTSDGSSNKPHYYHERLVAAGVSQAETAAQSKAIVFAGADSTAVMLATTLFHLVQNASARDRLRAELELYTAQAHSSGKVQTQRTTVDGLPFLRACVKEGLRLGMANPTRLTRVVPKSGLLVDGVMLPAGTIVGCGAYNLHHDSAVFPEPFSFRPGRWMDSGTDSSLHRPGMEKSMMPFGAGLRGCIGKNLAMHQLHETVIAVVLSGALEGAVTCQEDIEVIEWFNGDIKGHVINIEWPTA